MKKLFLPVLFFGLILAGCQSDTYKQNMANGQTYFTNKDYDNAMKSFLAAYNEDQTEEAGNAYSSSLTAAYNFDKQEADKAFANLDYKKAKEYYKKVQKLETSKDEEVIKKTTDALALSEQRYEMQLKLDKYQAWLNDVLDDSYVVADQWRETDEKASAGRLSIKDVRDTASDLIIDINTLSSKTDKEAFQHLIPAEIHTQLLKIYDNAHNSLTNVVTVSNDPKLAMQDVLNSGQGVSTLKTDLQVYLDTLRKNYVDLNGLKLDKVVAPGLN